MVRRVFAVFAAIVTTVLLSGPVAAERHALVIGNAAYAHASRLQNPLNDAADMAAALGRLGFQVTNLRDADAAAMRRALVEFGARATGAEMAVVFYAGHGIEIAGENYLLPVDVRLARDVDADEEAVKLSSVMNRVAGAAKLGLVILDSCRDNPFKAKMARAFSRRDAVAGGLAKVEPPGSVLVAFAAKEGTFALDGAGGRNSPFTTSLLKHLETPGLEINLVFRRVRDEVIQTTRREQEPHVYGSLSAEELFLRAGTREERPRPAVDPLAPVKDAYAMAERIGTETAWSAFLATNPPEPYAGFARAAREKVKVASVPPSPAMPPVALDPSRSAAPLTPAEERSLKRGDVFQECSECPSMVVVPPGTFMMGAADDDDGDASQRPRHEVRLSRAFAVGRFEVSFAEWDACVTGGGCGGYRPDDNKWGRGKQPVINVNWTDAKAYVEWLNRTHHGGRDVYRLLTEAEWEYVARAGTTTRFWFGSSVSTDDANFDGRDASKGRPKGAFRQRTVPVDSFQPNAFGLYNVHGNVSEWVDDYWVDQHRGAPSDGHVVRRDGDFTSRVLRGGSWVDTAKNLGSAVRNGGGVKGRGGGGGFRVARTLVGA